MLIVQIIGGLGNQMFQYAAGRALAERLGVSLTLDISAFENYTLHQGFELSRVFAMNPAKATRQDLRRVLGWQHSPMVRLLLSRRPFVALRSRSFVSEPHFHHWNGFDQLGDNIYLVGYWQSEKYFKPVITQIREDFRFRPPLEGRNIELAARMSQTQAISLHVRRGDYVSNPEAASTHGLCSLDYYRAAVAHVVGKVEKPEFFIFSDDIDWARANLLLDFPHHFVAHNQGAASYIDMRLMSLCSYHVIANSSFSWWGAWLNPKPEKIVVAPRQWFANDNNVQDLFPENCVLL